MANESAKTERSDTLDQQVEAMARAGSEAEVARDPNVEAQLDDLLASAPEPDQTLGSLDRQLAALTAELLEGDFADSTDTVTEQIEAASTTTPVAPASSQPEAITPSVETEPGATGRSGAEGPRLMQTSAGSAADASAAEPSAGSASTQTAASSASDDIDEVQAAPLPVLPPAPSKLDGEMTLEEQMAALGADLLDGDFETVAGDVVGSTKDTSGSSAASEAASEAAEAASIPAAAHATTTGEPGADRGSKSPAEEPRSVLGGDARATSPAPEVSAGPTSMSAAPTAAPVNAAPPAPAPVGGTTGPGTSAPEATSTSPPPSARAAEPAAPQAPKPAGPPLHVRVRRTVARALRIAEPAARQAAALASKPLEGRPPVIRQSIGWLAIWTGFLALCAIMASLMSHPPKPPESDAAPAELAAPPEGPTTPAGPRAGENLRGRPIPPDQGAPSGH